jgi:hypothetical protein
MGTQATGVIRAIAEDMDIRLIRLQERKADMQGLR